MKFRIILIFQAMLLSGLVSSQLTVSGSMTPSALVQSLVGPGVTVSNITFNGALQAVGNFNGSNSNLGISSGLLMTSGDIINAPGPNNQTDADAANGLPGDADLDLLMSNVDSYDATIIEFDLISYSDTIKFEYVFGSEEYMEWVDPLFSINDAFGFFVSGPGISGPYSNNSRNVALIPGTNLPVTMQNVNLNNNSQYYVDNGNNGVNSVPGGATVQYDGFTVVLTAAFPVVCGQTYHLKLAIADGGDDAYDSGVFLKAGSLTGNGVSATPLLSYGNINDTILYEGCGNAQIIFQRNQSTLAVSDTVFLSYGGTALEGVDFPSMPDTLIFIPGQDSAFINLNAFIDASTEGLENLLITFSVNNAICGITSDQVSIYLNEQPPLSVSAGQDILQCSPGAVVSFSATASGGVPPYSFTWSNGANSQTINLNPTQTTVYTVSVTDFCSTVSTLDSVTAIAFTPLTLSTVADAEVCGEKEISISVIANGGAGGNYNYSWSTFLGSDLVTNPAASSTSVLVTQESGFVISVTDGCNITVNDTVLIHFESNCDVVIPNVVTPNGDDNNNALSIKNLERYPGSGLKVFDRWGHTVFVSSNYSNDWIPSELVDGTYYYILNLSDGRALPGFITVISGN